MLLGMLIAVTSVSVATNLKAEAAPAKSVAIYRLYNPSTGEHLYTADKNEKDVLYNQAGWGYEGTGWYAPSAGTAVYRLNNPKLKNHLYTTDKNEVKVLTSKYGWKKDNNGQPVFYSGGNVGIYRVYNAKLSGLHHLTTDSNEYKVLPQYGWSQEGVKLKAIALGKQVKTQYSPKIVSQRNLNNVVSIARSYVGYGPNVFENWWGAAPYQNWWCSVFADYVFSRAGIGGLYPNTYLPIQVYQFAKAQNRMYSAPKVGDVVILNWRSHPWSAGGPGHIGIVIGVNGASYTTVEGNVDNKVMVMNRSVYDPSLVGFYRPKY